MSAVSIRHVSKSFEDVQALKDIDLDIGKGELFGFIGPDGAGKTTLFRLVLSLLIPDEGSISVLGNDTVRDFRAIRRICGYMPGHFALYQDLTVEENLRFFATAFGTTISENYHLIKDIYSHIEPFRKRQAGKLSGGMKQKLALSCALIHKPELLVLDEPTTGVDAVSRREFWDMLQRLSDEGLTIIVSTPYMDEASRCSRVALIQKGHIMSVETPDNIRSSFRRPLYRLSGAPAYSILKALRTLPGKGKAHVAGKFVHYAGEEGGITIDGLRAWSEQSGLGDVLVEPVSPDIEDCFIELMQENDHE